MMRKAKQGISALLIIGWVFAILGGIYLAVGLSVWYYLGGETGSRLGIVFLGIGGFVLILGMIFLIAVLIKRNRNNKLIASGRYIWGEVVDCVPDYNIRINGRHPCRILVQYRDGLGTIHMFKSGNCSMYRESSVLHKKVKVYISDDSYKHYYVDAEGVFPRVVEH